MFTRISPRYDLTNDILSVGVHRLWRRYLARRVAPQPGTVLLDLCTGTGDVAFEMSRARGVKVIGIDFVFPMLTHAVGKDRQQQVSFCQGDALRIPLKDCSVDYATISFGIRNVDSTPEALKELRRVLKPGGKLFVLEFGQPESKPISTAYQFYSKHILPRIGGALSGDRSAYEYLPETSARYPCRDEFVALMRDVGFHAPSWTALSLGIAYLYEGTK